MGPHKHKFENPSGNAFSRSTKRIWLGAESNRRHEDFQSSALPTELPSRIALPLSRCIERRVLIKAENAQPSTPSCSGDLSALTERRLTIVGQAFLLAVSLRQAGALPYKVSGRRAHPNGAMLCGAKKEVGSTESRPTKEVLPEAALQINRPFEER
jgi:hypothetical protein